MERSNNLQQELFRRDHVHSNSIRYLVQNVTKNQSLKDLEFRNSLTELSM